MSAPSVQGAGASVAGAAALGELTAPGAAVNGGGPAGHVASGSDGSSLAGAGAAANTTLGAASQTPVDVGVYVVRNAAAAVNAFGAGQFASNFDQQSQAQALAADINRHGGLAGHPIRLVVASLDATSAQSYASQEQAACDTFTEDRHPIAVLVPYTGFVAGGDTCLAQRRVPLITSDEYGADSTWLHASSAGRFALQVPEWDRVVPALIASVVARRLVTSHNKIGLLTGDDAPSHRRVTQLWKPALAAHGLTLTDTAYLHFPTSTPDTATTARDEQNTVLRWKAMGIDVVLDDGGNDYLFQTAAANQDYHPFYALTTLSSPASFDGASGFRGAGIGWNPYTDTGQDLPPNDAYRWCKRATNSSGGTSWDGDAVGRSEALMSCDAFDALRLAVVRSAAATRAGVTRGVPLLGTAVQSAFSFGFRLDASHPDGISGFRDLTYDGTCGCTRYTSGVRRIDL